MSLFSKRQPDETPMPRPVRGGCSECDMHGPKRTGFRQASKDATDHGQRMHGNTGHPNLYVESTN
jgi:hypothetical protein